MYVLYIDIDDAIIIPLALVMDDCKLQVFDITAREVCPGKGGGGGGGAAGGVAPGELGLVIIFV